MREFDFNEVILFGPAEGSLRIDSTRPSWNDGKKLIKATTTSTFDGKGHSRILAMGEANAAPSGRYYPGAARHLDVAYIGYKPLMYAVRPASSKYVAEKTIDRFKRADAGSFDTSDGSLIRMNLDNVEIWIDASKSTGLTRLVSRYPNDKPRVVVEVDKIQQTNGLWIPLAWRSRLFGENGSLQSETAWIVDDYELNPPTNESDFLVQFPPGAIVERVQERGPGKRFLIDEFGREKPFSSKELKNGKSTN